MACESLPAEELRTSPWYEGRCGEMLRRTRNVGMDSGARQVVAEDQPVLVQLAAQLADAGLAESMLGGQILRAFAQCHVLRDQPVAGAQPREPGRVVDPEGGLVGRGRDRVVAQRVDRFVAF